MVLSTLRRVKRGQPVALKSCPVQTKMPCAKVGVSVEEVPRPASMATLRRPVGLAYGERALAWNCRTRSAPLCAGGASVRGRRGCFGAAARGYSVTGGVIAVSRQDVEKSWHDPQTGRKAVRFCLAVLALAAVVIGLTLAWAFTQRGDQCTDAEFAVCASPDRYILAMVPTAILLGGGIVAFVAQLPALPGRRRLAHLAGGRVVPLRADAVLHGGVRARGTQRITAHRAIRIGHSTLCSSAWEVEPSSSPGTAAATRADHEELSLGDSSSRCLPAPVPHEDAAHRDVRVVRGESGEGLGEHCRLLRRDRLERRAAGSGTASSVQACRATRSTPRADASANASATAGRPASDPSTPTSTSPVRPSTPSTPSSLITATAHLAWRLSPN